MFTAGNFPIVSQIVSKPLGLDIVNVQPMNGPKGVLTYMDYVYGNRELTSIEKIALEKLKKILDYEWQIANVGEEAYFFSDCNDAGFDILEKSGLKFQIVKIYETIIPRAIISIYDSGLLEKGVITASKTGII
jgi:hypothetical protein